MCETGEEPIFKKKKLYFVVGILGLLAVALAGFSNLERAQPVSNVIFNPDTLPGIQSGEAPWQPELTHLRERLNLMGLPALAKEGTVVHVHQHLDIYIHGKSVQVPAGIGVHPQEGFISIIHTHDASGIIHIESPIYQTFMLGQFFDIWGVRFTSKCLGAYCEAQQNFLEIFINGKAMVGDPRFIKLTGHVEIVISYGTAGELPKPVPSRYTFPPGT